MSFSGGGEFAGSGKGIGAIGQIGSSAGAAVSDIFAAEGDVAEAKNYDMAAALARANVNFTQSMTSIREMQTQREVSGIIGKQQTGFAGGNIGGDRLGARCAALKRPTGLAAAVHPGRAGRDAASVRAGAGAGLFHHG